MQSPDTTQPPSPRKARTRTAPTPPKSKKDQLPDLLRAKGGATIQQLSDALAWQPHTVRAALSGLRKADIAVEKMPAREGEATRYRIAAKRGRAAQ